MTCKDAINSDTSSDDKKVYLLNEIRRCNKIFESDLEGTNDQDENNRIKIYQLLCATWQHMHHSSTHVHFLTHNP